MIGLGIDAGGTQTRWALAHTSGEVLSQGAAAGLTALQMSSDVGRAHIANTLASIATAIARSPAPTQICAGVTGHTEGGELLRTLIADTFLLDASAVSLRSDIEITFLDLFAPGEGYVIYAGTGTIAAFIDYHGIFHRAGGRGAIVDDAGGGYWIAVEALRHVWREEDALPGAWRDSAMARNLFDQLGGSDWALTRQFVYELERGEIGKLAQAVAAAANEDVVAMNILQRAGDELGRLGNAMIARFGVRPMALAGRAPLLHAAIEQALRRALPAGTDLVTRNSDAHIAAARIAAKSVLPKYF